jgi:DNA-binding phage protein
MAKLPHLVAAAASREWDATLLSCALAAVAASKGFASVAEAVFELNAEVAEDFLKWHLDR